MPYKNLEDRRKNNKERRAKNRDKVRAYHREYYKTYPRKEELRWYLIRVVAMARCRRRDDFDVTIDNVLDIWRTQQGRCALTGLPMTHSRKAPTNYDTNASVDRINSNVGYVKNNVRLVCKRINVMRMHMSDEEFLGWCKLAIKHSTEAANELFRGDNFAGD